MIINDKEETIYTGEDRSIDIIPSLVSPYNTLKDAHDVIKKDISDNKDDIEKLNENIHVIENNIIDILSIDLNIMQCIHEIEERTADLDNNQQKIQKDIYNIDLRIKALDSYIGNIDSEEWFLEMKRNTRRYYFKNLFDDFQYQIYTMLAILAIGVMLFLTFIF